MKYDEYLHSEYWHEVSRRVKERGDYRCQVCNSPHDLQAHHRTYEHRGNELNHLNDLICLCQRCHAMFHGKTVKAEKPKKPKKHREFKLNPKLNYSIVEQDEIPESVIPLADNDGFIVLNKSLIEYCRTDVGGYTSATLMALGVGRKPSRGWPAKLVGTKILRSNYLSAINGRRIRF